MEKNLSLAVITALEGGRAYREILAAELKFTTRTWKRERASQALVNSFRNASKIFPDMLKIQRTAIDLDNIAFAVDQKRSWNADVAMPVEERTVEKVVDGDPIIVRFTAI